MVDDVRALQVLAEPRRWRLMAELAAGDRRVGELTRLLGEPQNLVSYHLRALREVGLVSARRSAFDGRDTYYRAELSRCAAVFGGAAAALHRGLAPAGASGLPPASPRRRVLFLCTGNSARSQMAEALLRHRTGGLVEARSAGSHPKPLHPLAIEVMAARGIDIGEQQPTHLRRYARTRFDRVITLCDRVREVCPEFPGHPVAAHWSMPDPAGEGTTDAERRAAFERAADDLAERVGFLVVQLSNPAGGTHA